MRAVPCPDHWTFESDGCGGYHNTVTEWAFIGWQAAVSAATEPMVWRPMETAPKDGTIVRLLVAFTEHPLEDSNEPLPTIGGNTSDNTKEDEPWLFAGWSWQHDCFTQGEGTPMGWLPMLAGAVPQQAEPTTWRCFHCEEVFTDRDSARDHFGSSEQQRPACEIDIKHIRWLEESHRRNVEDDTEALRTIRGLAGEHETLRRRAEDDGFARGLAEAKKHPEELGLVRL